jgi:hypothetical protein
MILSNFLHFWMHRTTSFCRNHASRDVVIANPKNQSAALRQIVAWVEKNGCGYWLFAKGDRLFIVSHVRHTNVVGSHLSR